MKKTLFVLLTLLLCFSFLTCEEEPDEPPPPPPPSLDERLIGGRWYFPESYDNLNVLTPKTSTGYYKFTDDSEFVYSEDTDYHNNIADNLSGNIVYSKNGIVYFNEPYRNVMKFSFHDTFPYKSGVIPDDTTYPTTSDQRYSLNKLALKGDLITYRIYNGGAFYSDSRYGSYWFLVRFKDDGTPYRTQAEYQTP